jgi:hypothetical protein
VPANEGKVFSMLSPEQAEQLGGLTPQAICGSFVKDAKNNERFLVNPLFVKLMHDTIRRAGPDDATLRAEAADYGNDGWLYVIDLRTPEGSQDRVPLEDVVGSFEVRDGVLTGRYESNVEHLLWSANGMFRLPPGLAKAIVDELMMTPFTCGKRA